MNPPLRSNQGYTYQHSCPRENNHFSENDFVSSILPHKESPRTIKIKIVKPLLQGNGPELKAIGKGEKKLPSSTDKDQVYLRTPTQEPYILR